MASIVDAFRAGGLAAGRTLLDVGVGDGRSLGMYAPPAVRLVGLEIDETAAGAARGRGVDAIVCDLDHRWPVRDASVDAVSSNQVIEHVVDTDLFVAEALRVLRPGGLVAVATENLASWHNIGALVLGWQAFSLANVSATTQGLGNPLSHMRGDEPIASERSHRRIFSYRGLAELFRLHGFEDVRIVGSGYYPLPSRLGRLDPRHAAFITVVGRKGSV